MFQILEATGCPFDKEKLLKETVHYDIRDFGAAKTEDYPLPETVFRPFFLPVLEKMLLLKE
jgi:hypothetical protein